MRSNSKLPPRIADTQTDRHTSPRRSGNLAAHLGGGSGDEAVRDLGGPISPNRSDDGRVLLLTRTPGYEYLNNVTVVEITTTTRSIPQEVALSRREGLARASVANFDSLHVVAKHRLAARIGALSSRRIVEAKRALGHALGWPELKQL